MFDKISKKQSEVSEKEMQAKIDEKVKMMDAVTDEILKLFSEKDLDLNDAQMITQALGKKINTGGSKVKVAAIL